MTIVDKVRSEKLRADAMRTTCDDPIEQSYWQGYRIGLTCQSQYHAALLAAVGSPDLDRDARGRGYRAGRAFTEQKGA